MYDNRQLDTVSEMNKMLVKARGMIKKLNNGSIDQKRLTELNTIIRAAEVLTADIAITIVSNMEE